MHGELKVTALYLNIKSDLALEILLCLSCFLCLYRYCARFTIVSTSVYCNTTEYSKKWANELQLRRTVCVQCDPFAMHKDLGTRCHGHGVYKEITGWNAVDVPYCTGLWRQETKPSDCVCDADLKDSFILIWKDRLLCVSTVYMIVLEYSSLKHYISLQLVGQFDE